MTPFILLYWSTRIWLLDGSHFVKGDLSLQHISASIFLEEVNWFSVLLRLMPVVSHLVSVIIETSMEVNGNNNIKYSIFCVLIQTKSQLV